MVTVAVSGCLGRMGSRIVALAQGTPGIAVTGALEVVGCPQRGRDVGEVLGLGRLGVVVADDAEAVIRGVDVLIDFSAPEPTVRHIELAARLRRAAVVGTTGFTPDQRAVLEGHGRVIPLLVSPNMSVGVNLLFQLVHEAARRLDLTYDAEIVEVHHRGKRDAPSGTAVRLAEVIAGARGQRVQDVLRAGRAAGASGRARGEIGVHALRAGDVVGEHTVVLAGAGEQVTLGHRAETRDTFAIGALRAAAFLAGKPPAIYTMADVLGLPGMGRHVEERPSTGGGR